MQEILIREELLDEVKAGRKVTTCRFGKRNYTLGETRLKSNSTENFAIIDIIRQEYRDVGSLDDETAAQDGFNTRDELITVMKEIYGEIKNSDIITIVYFRLT